MTLTSWCDPITAKAKIPNKVNTDIKVFLLLAVNSPLSFQGHCLGLQLINALLGSV